VYRCHGSLEAVGYPVDILLCIIVVEGLIEKLCIAAGSLARGLRAGLRLRMLVKV
jgi:hypothetical protein